MEDSDARGVEAEEDGSVQEERGRFWGDEAGSSVSDARCAIEEMAGAEDEARPLRLPLDAALVVVLAPPNGPPPNDGYEGAWLGRVGL